MAAFTSATEPEMVMVEDPSAPASKVRPVVWARVIVPSTVSVTVTVSLSTSPTERPVIALPVEFTAKLCAAGGVSVGASSVAPTVTVVVTTPSAPSPSSSVMVKVRSPAVGVSPAELV